MEPNKVESVQSQDSGVNQVISVDLRKPIDLLVSSWNLFKQNWKVLSLVAMFPSFFMIAGQILMVSRYNSLPLLSLSVFLSFIGIIFSIAMQPAIVNAIHVLSTESSRPINFKDQYKFGFKLFWSMVLIAILYGFIAVGSTIFFIIPAIVIGVYSSMYIYTRTIDDKKGLHAFEESYSLVYNKWLKILGRMAFLGVIYLIFNIIIIGLMFIIRSLMGIESNSTEATIISNLAGLIMSGVMVPIGLIYMYNLFISMKSCREVGVSTVNFRRWIIAFMVLGIVVLVGAILIGVILGVGSLK